MRFWDEGLTQVAQRIIKGRLYYNCAEAVKLADKPTRAKLFDPSHPYDPTLFLVRHPAPCSVPQTN